MFELWIFLCREAFDPVCKGPALWNFGISEELYFFRRSEKFLWGKKRTALFQTQNWEKSSFFNTVIRVFGYTVILKYWANRVKKNLCKIFPMSGSLGVFLTRISFLSIPVIVTLYSVCTHFKLRSISLEVLRSPLHIQAAVIKTHTNLHLTANGCESTSPVSLFTHRATFAMCDHRHRHWRHLVSWLRSTSRFCAKKRINLLPIIMGPWWSSPLPRPVDHAHDDDYHHHYHHLRHGIMRELVLTGQHVQLSPFDGRGQYRTDAGAQYKIIILINNIVRIKWLDACVYDKIIIVLSIITSYRT